MTIDPEKHWHNKRHPDDESLDHVTIECVERWKSSYMSGDEWRFSYVVRGYCKGTLVMEFARNSMEAACAHLAYEKDRMRDEGRVEAYAKKERDSCNQPGCSNEATVWYRLKQEYSAAGEGPLPESPFPRYRQFCERHKLRGDCAMEDADSNYLSVGNPRLRLRDA